MWEKLCEKCGVIFTTPKTFDEHVCAVPPPANDESRSVQRRKALQKGEPMLMETERMRERIMLNLARSLERLSVAVKSLGRVKDGKTLFEHSPSKDAEAYSAWTELDAAQKDAAVKLSGYRIAALASSEGPDNEIMLRRELWASHGHAGIYGDDGEMQCGECGIDL